MNHEAQTFADTTRNNPCNNPRNNYRKKNKFIFILQKFVPLKYIPKQGVMDTRM